MAGNNLSPRQKMIGMMYLVLTAMLALNVSKEVLDAFSKINGGIVKTTQNFDSKNDEVYSAFMRAAETNEAKAGPWRDKAFSVKKEADKIVDDIQRLKFDMVMLSDKKVTFDGVAEPIVDKTYDDLTDAQKHMLMVDVVAKKDRERPGELMINQGKGKDLQLDLEKYRDFLISLVDDPAIQSSLKATFSFPDKKEKYGSGMQSWVQQNFQDMPLIAAVTILSKIQADLRNAESDVIKFLQQEIDAGSLKFTSAEGIQISPRNYVFLGDSFKADVFIAAKDTTQSPVIYVGDYDVDENGKYFMTGDYDSIPVSKGKGKFAVKTRSEGYKKWGGLISMKTDGGTKLYPFNGEYQVAKTSYVVSPTAMNILYILGDNIGNPIDVSVPGVAKDKISLTCDNGIIKKVGSTWEVYPKKTGKAKINVSAEIQDKKRFLGNMEFRVKRVPDPKKKLLGSKNNIIKKSQLLSKNCKVIAQLEDFEFKGVKYQVVGFTLRTTLKGEIVTHKAKGNKLTDDMRSTIDYLQIGSFVTFSNIMAKGPSGKIRNLDALEVKLN